MVPIDTKRVAMGTAPALWNVIMTAMVHPLFLFFFTLLTGPRRSLSLKLRDTRV